jgi:acetyl-CoA acetyltransferase
MTTDIYLAAGVRTALGNFGGSLKDVATSEVAAHAARACIARSGADPEAIDHVVYTTTCPTDRDSLYPARVVGIKSGIPEAAAALDVSRACASGLQAILSAGQQIQSGHSRLDDRTMGHHARQPGARGYARVVLSLSVQRGIYG